MHLRSLLTLAGGALLLAAGASSAPIEAQTPDSIARRDSALAERERRRIRGERVRTTSPRPRDSAGTPADTSPRRSRRPSWRAELGAAAAARYSTDPNGATVRAPLLPMGGVGAAWAVGARTELGVALRAAAGPLTLSSGGDDWGGGTVVQADLLALGEWRPRPWGTLRGGVGAAWVRGPSDVAPFRFNNGTPLHVGGLVGAGARVLRSRPLDAFLDVHGIRYGGGSLADPIREPGTVLRFLVGFRYGR